MSDETTTAVPDGVGLTAIGVAAMRAQESQRPDRLFDDPLAARFLEAAGWPLPPAELAEAERDVPPHWRLLLRSIPIRTRFLDEYVHAAVDAGCRQLVLLGAGLDTRAFRLAWPPGSRVFEVDLPPMLDFKREVLARAGAAPACERIPVPADLTADWPAALIRAGLDTAAATAWIAEGLLMYFSAEQNEQLLGRVAELSAPGSRLALTTLSQDRLDELNQRLDQGEVPGAEVMRMWRSGAPADPVSWLAGHGWRAELFDPAERAATYGRPGLFDGLGREPGARALISAVRDSSPHPALR
ncbi:class I SAM-dependent methyltransferase [Amycolatopsis anabasis]|uniref:class I SAM-dependent methyltransferase n=1 Tax=Amycolatopsis anabasis TaxID=1840409 RepID=UPI001FE4AD61|nr:class I SAM-dependent methyltransferase [Amycolatopsis anabasis]